MKTKELMEFRIVQRITHSERKGTKKVLQVKHNIVIKETGYGEMLYENSSDEWEDVPIIKEEGNEY